MYLRLHRLIATLVFGLLAQAAAWACDPCGMHSTVQVPGLASALRTTGLEADTFTVGVQEQLSTFDIRGDSALRTTNTDLELVRTLSVTQFSLAYNATESVGVQLNLPLVARIYDRFERFKRVNDSEVGLGDASAFMTWSPYSRTDVESRFFVAGLAGVKLPTGDAGSLRRASLDDGASATERLQGRGLSLGSGSWDIPLGVVSYARSGRFALFGSAQYTFRGTGEAQYRFANDFTWSIAPGWLALATEENSLALSIVFSGEHKAADRLDGLRLEKTATENIYLGPEVFYAVDSVLTLQAGIDLPLSVDVGGAAVRPETRTRVGVTWRF